MEITSHRGGLVISALQKYSLHSEAWGLQVAFHSSIGLVTASGESAQVIKTDNSEHVARALSGFVNATDVAFFEDNDRLQLAVVDHDGHVVKICNPETGNVDEVWGQELGLVCWRAPSPPASLGTPGHGCGGRS